MDKTKRCYILHNNECPQVNHETLDEVSLCLTFAWKNHKINCAIKTDFLMLVTIIFMIYFYALPKQRIIDNTIFLK